MKPFRLLTLTAGAIAIAAMLTGCNHKELAAPYGGTTQINLHYDWSRATGDAFPANVDLYLYPGLVFNTPKEGGTLNLQPGTYPGFAYAPETGSLILDNPNDKDGCIVTTGDADITGPLGIDCTGCPRPAGTEDERVAAAPDRAWYGKTELSVPESKTPVDHTIYMEDLFVTYHVTVSDINGFELLTNQSGILTGLAGGVHPATGELTDEKVTIPFPYEKNAQEEKLTAQFYAFGDCPGTPGQHILGIYAVTEEGDKYLFTFDVTGQVHDQRGQKDIYINVSGIDLVKKVDNQFGIDVDNWKSTEDIPLIMN